MVVSAPSGGIVSELFVRDGEIVTKGQTLMVVESEGTQARLVSIISSWNCSVMKISYSIYSDQSGQFDLALLPEAPD